MTRTGHHPNTSPLSRTKQKILSAALPILLTILEYSCSSLLRCLNFAVTLLESTSSWLFDFASVLFRIQPCGTYRPKNSAILILGVQEGIGRSAALKFSELGYTVFALCPNEYEGDIQESQPPLDGHRHVSSLLYIWHNRKERSRSLPWGLLAPVSLDIWSNSQRQRAVETVQAYCAKYTLQLIALVVSPVPSHSTLSPYMTLHRLTARGVDTCSFCSAEEERWRRRVLSQVTEPILIAHDYTWLLRQASGRIIVISPCSEDGVWSFGSSIEEARRSVCQHLCDALQPLGIRVISIVTGPLTESSPKSFTDKLAVGCRGQSLDGRTIQSIGRRRKLEGIADLFAHLLSVKDDEIFELIQQIVESRHPKLVYAVGVLPLMHAAFNSVPTIVLSTFKWLSLEVLLRNS